MADKVINGLGKNMELEFRLSVALNNELKRRIDCDEGNPAAIKDDFLRDATKLIYAKFSLVFVNNTGGKRDSEPIEISI